MTLVRSTCVALTIALAVSPASAKKAKVRTPVEKQEPLPADTQNLLQDKLPETPANVLACAGAFGRDTSQTRLAERFGAKNVAFRDVDGPEGSKEKATVLFDDDPTRRAVFYWRDEKAKANPGAIVIGAPSTWTGPGGIRNGMTMKEAEKLNGGAFKLKGFGWDAGGTASNLKGGFAGAEGGCSISVRFEPGIANPLSEKFSAISGDKDVPSSHPLMRRARPQVSEWSVNYR